MTWKLEYSPTATTQIKRLHPTVARRVLGKFAAIAQNPYTSSKALVGNLSSLRSSRVGQIRILFEIVEESELIVVERIDYRGQVYRLGFRLSTDLGRLM